MSVPMNYVQKPASGWLVSICRKQVMQALDSLRDVAIEVSEGDWIETVGDVRGERVFLRINDPDAWVDIALGGSIGAAEAYMAGAWTTSDLTALVRVFARNMQLLDKMESSADWIMQPLRRLLHWRHRNSRANAKKNIHAHYDLGNAMFAHFLDPRMMYSSAIYPNQQSTLSEAADYKLKLIGDKLDLKPTDHVVEIGSGWGGLAIYLAQNYGCKVTTTTISQAQYDEARRRIDAAGLSGQISLLLNDYRDLDGQYDKLVSVEMIEAVGLAYLPDYFKTCSRLLKPEGVMLLQSITIADQRYDYAAKHVDFIQRYIFPGGALPSSTRIAECMRDYTDLQLRHVQDIGLHYAKTLQHWRDNFHHQWSSIQSLGYDERFRRLWHYYLCYCEGGFLERSISCGHYLFHKPRATAAVPT